MWEGCTPRYGVEGVGWASEHRVGMRLRDVCKPGDSKLSYHIRSWSRDIGLEGGWNRAKKTVWMCKGGECRSQSCDLHDEGTFMAQCGLGLIS